MCVCVHKYVPLCITSLVVVAEEVTVKMRLRMSSGDYVVAGVSDYSCMAQPALRRRTLDSGAPTPTRQVTATLSSQRLKSLGQKGTGRCCRRCPSVGLPQSCRRRGAHAVAMFGKTAWMEKHITRRRQEFCGNAIIALCASVCTPLRRTRKLAAVRALTAASEGAGAAAAACRRGLDGLLLRPVHVLRMQTKNL